MKKNARRLVIRDLRRVEFAPQDFRKRFAVFEHFDDSVSDALRKSLLHRQNRMIMAEAAEKAELRSAASSHVGFASRSDKQFRRTNILLIVLFIFRFDLRLSNPLAVFLDLRPFFPFVGATEERLAVFLRRRDHKVLE